MINSNSGHSYTEVGEYNETENNIEEFLKDKPKTLKFKEAEIKTMLQMVTSEVISFSRFVELINERIK